MNKEDVKQNYQQALRYRERRKLDTRRKIILGGAILAAVEDGEISALWLYEFLHRRVFNEKDRIAWGLKGGSNVEPSSKYLDRLSDALAKLIQEQTKTTTTD